LQNVSPEKDSGDDTSLPIVFPPIIRELDTGDHTYCIPGSGEMNELTSNQKQLLSQINTTSFPNLMAIDIPLDHSEVRISYLDEIFVIHKNKNLTLN
jgi:hypothetical protein